MGKNKKRQYDVLIIGGGAAGCMAAITAAREECSVCILEKQNKIGKKLLATGNGKCNFTNASMESFRFYGDEKFISQVLQQFTVEDCLDFFHSIGIFPKSRNGYYYPQSEQAASVVQAFEQELSRLGVQILLSTEVTAIDSSDSGVEVVTNAGTISGKKLIIATGLLASPKLGSDGSLFDIIKGLGHRFAPVLPALCGFYCKGLQFKKVSGVRVQGTVAAYIDHEKMAEDSGELQFTDYGLSGIPVFQISHVLSKGVYEKRNVTIIITLLPEFDKNMLMDELNYRKKRFPDVTVDYFLNGLLPQKLSDMIIEKLHWERERFISALSANDIEKLADTLQHLQLKVTNYRDFEFAQVCTGGIPTTDIEPGTLESRFTKNVYFAGEILDVDGICGGYNLHFAWATGYMAGKAVCH